MPIFKYTFFSLIPQKTFLFFFFLIYMENLNWSFLRSLLLLSEFWRRTKWIGSVYIGLLNFDSKLFKKKNIMLPDSLKRLKDLYSVSVQFILLADRKQKLIPASMEKELKFQNWLSSMLPLKCACLSAEKKKFTFSLHLTSQFLFIL